MKSKIIIENMPLDEYRELIDSSDLLSYEIELSKVILVDKKQDEKTELQICESSCNFYSIGQDDCFIAGHEFGYTHLILEDYLDSAWETFLDDSPTIDDSELPDAYGCFDKFVEHMEKLGHDNTQQLREFCSRYEIDFFGIKTDEMHTSGEYWELIEGYEYQPNYVGTGIVNVGHYTYIHELSTLNDYELLISGTIEL